MSAAEKLTEIQDRLPASTAKWLKTELEELGVEISSMDGTGPAPALSDAQFLDGCAMAAYQTMLANVPSALGDVEYASLYRRLARQAQHAAVAMLHARRQRRVDAKASIKAALDAAAEKAKTATVED